MCVCVWGGGGNSGGVGERERKKSSWALEKKQRTSQIWTWKAPPEQPEIQGGAVELSCFHTSPSCRPVWVAGIQTCDRSGSRPPPNLQHTKIWQEKEKRTEFVARFSCFVADAAVGILRPSSSIFPSIQKHQWRNKSHTTGQFQEKTKINTSQSCLVWSCILLSCLVLALFLALLLSCLFTLLLHLFSCVFASSLVACPLPGLCFISGLFRPCYGRFPFLCLYPCFCLFLAFLSLSCCFLFLLSSGPVKTTKQDKTRQDKTRQDKTRQDKTTRQNDKTTTQNDNTIQRTRQDNTNKHNITNRHNTTQHNS